jgi:uncharacterized small protein (DUF1192 family)
LPQTFLALVSFEVVIGGISIFEIFRRSPVLYFVVGGNVLVRRRGVSEDVVMSTFGEDLLYFNVGFLEDPINALMNEARRLRAIRLQMEELGSSAEAIERLQSLFFLWQNRGVRYPATRLYSEQDYGI